MEIILRFNLESEIEKRKAYLKCIDYADLNLGSDEYNLFILEAANKLGQKRIIKDFIKSSIVSEIERAKKAPNTCGIWG